MSWPTEHRPWPPPSGPWIMAQNWHDLLFAHWSLPVEALRPHVPDSLPIDTFEGQAWIAVVPFRMTGVRPRFVPSLPWVSAFPELNVRTYTTLEGRPGIWFFSLDAGNPLAVAAARRFFHLPYFNARMSLAYQGPDIVYHNHRTHPGAPAADLDMRYRPTGDVFHAARGSLEYFLTERYCLYTVDSRQRIYRCEIHHPPWPLQIAEAEIERNTMTSAGIALPDEKPLLHFARFQPVVVWPLRRLAVNASN